MKRLLVSFLALVALVQGLQAQPRFRAVIFAMTDDPTIGRGAVRSMGFVNNMLEEVSSAIDIPLEVEGIFRDRECTKASLMRWLNSFECGPDDIVVFCYLGHGGRSPRDTSLFSQMVLNATTDAGYVSLEAVKDAIMAKGPRFLLCIGDLCNSMDPGLSPKFTILNAAASSVTTDTDVRAYRKLFLEQRGAVITSGSAPKEYSWANNDIAPNPPIGMLYTTLFTQLMQVYASDASAQWSWGDFLGMLQELVGEIPVGKNGAYRQHPVFRIEPVRKQPPAPVQPREPRKVKPVGGLHEQLVNIADDRTDSYQRISMAKALTSGTFAADAVVKVVGRDNQTVLSVETAQDFMSRIATARRLRGISIVDESRNADGKVVRLVVHEVYSKKSNQ